MSLLKRKNWHVFFTFLGLFDLLIISNSRVLISSTLFQDISESFVHSCSPQRECHRSHISKRTYKTFMSGIDWMVEGRLPNKAHFYWVRALAFVTWFAFAIYQNRFFYVFAVPEFYSKSSLHTYCVAFICFY